MRIEGKSIPEGRRPIMDRIAEHVAWDGECLIWLGSHCRGYGQIWAGSRTDGTRTIFRVNRLVLAYSLGRELQPSEQALHTCDNPPCVNPDHLYAGTARRNIQDMLDRGRQRITPLRGELNGQARLTAAQVAEMRESGLPRRALREQYGVSKSTVARVLRRETWK